MKTPAILLECGSVSSGEDDRVLTTRRHSVCHRRLESAQHNAFIENVLDFGIVGVWVVKFIVIQRPRSQLWLQELQDPVV